MSRKAHHACTCYNSQLLLSALTMLTAGILTAEDATAAAACPGVDAIVCSNHGGRQLDGTLGAAVRT